MDTDDKFVAACLRYARRHRGLTATNPSVGTLLVQFDNDHARIVGRGVTAIGGRPHAERIAIDAAGDLALGSTAYVTLEPCAHHASTPPCAQALIDAGVSRVVTAWVDPDSRVDGQGHKMLSDAGIALETEVLSEKADEDLRGYLSRKTRGRPHVVLKLAVSADGWLGISDEEAVVTGVLARNYGLRMRAEMDAILVGKGTVLSDDPSLTSRLPGLEDRSPHRFVLDTDANLQATSQLVKSARTVPTSVITAANRLSDALTAAGVVRMPAEIVDGGLALAEVMEDMAAMGISTLMVEGGAAVARSFLEKDLVDEVVLFTSPAPLKGGNIVSPLTLSTMPNQFSVRRELWFGDDHFANFVRT